MSSDSYTCITCKLLFDSSDNQRAHYRTAWHCFNLKRKVAGMEPVPEAVFEEKVQELKAEQEKERNKKQKPMNPKKVHKKKKEKVRRRQEVVMEPILPPTLEEATAPAPVPAPEPPKQMTQEELIEERLRNADPIPINVCLFDNHASKDLESNLEYMRKHYGFFIPEIECLKDLPGFIGYLGEKVGIGYTCLWCEKAFMSARAVQNHMVDASHCKINFYGSEEEFEDFYDYSIAYTIIEEDEGEESEANESESEETQKSKALIVPSSLPLPQTVSLSENGAELILPNGVTLGNRSLALYYRQRPRPEESRTSVLINKLIKQYHVLGYIPPAEEKRELQRTARARYHREKHTLNMQVSANKLPKYMRHNTSMC
ncbi:pre-60S factor rei1 [Balamuthia mandrillaris]